MLPNQKAPTPGNRNAGEKNPLPQQQQQALWYTDNRVDRRDQYASRGLIAQNAESKVLEPNSRQTYSATGHLPEQPYSRQAVQPNMKQVIHQPSQIIMPQSYLDQQHIRVGTESHSLNPIEKQPVPMSQRRMSAMMNQQHMFPPPPVFSGIQSVHSSSEPKNAALKEPAVTSEVTKIQYPQLLSLNQPKTTGVSPVSTKSSKCQFFNDDDHIIDKKTPFKDLGGSTVIMELQSQFKIVHLGPQTILPAMCSVQTQGKHRTSTDLICVIDTSGSMAGTKIELVIDTLLYLLQLLNEYDRLCLITFNTTAERLCPLKTVTITNKPHLAGLIKSMFVGGGTNIMEGMNLALKTFKQRKFVNTVSSVFLLSDGQDGAALPLFRNTLADVSTGIYSLHSFGFGDDHDPALMTELAKMKQGNFYYIQELHKIDNAFVNALGALFSIAIEHVTIRLTLVAQGKFEGITISKVYGDLWRKQGNEYVIQLTQLISEISKDFVFELRIPPSALELGDFERNQTIIKAKFEAVTPSKEVLIGGSELNLTFFNHYESLVAREENTDVVENYLRVRAAQSMEESMKLANQKRYKDARQLLLRMADEIRSNQRIDQSNLKGLLEDLGKVSESCVENRYESSGTHLMNCMQYQHMAQNNIGYSNIVQTKMNTELEQNKQQRAQ